MSRPTREAPPDISKWSGRIRQARKDAKLTQAELADRISISQVSVSAWELGKAEPNLAQFSTIAAALGVDLIWLVFGREPTNSNSLPGIAAEAQKENRHFAWAFHEAARMFAEEGIKANFLYILTYVQKLLADAENSGDEGSVQEAITRKLEAERAELREGLEQILKKRL
jgi:transcriptional regulator with XRE-family HTH domain